MTKNKNPKVINSEVINDDKYNVEVAKDFTIPIIPSNVIDVNQPINGYTAGFMTRELIKIGENIVKEQQKNNNEKK